MGNKYTDTVHMRGSYECCCLGTRARATRCSWQQSLSPSLSESLSEPLSLRGFSYIQQPTQAGRRVVASTVPAIDNTTADHTHIIVGEHMHDYRFSALTF